MFEFDIVVELVLCIVGVICDGFEQYYVCFVVIIVCVWQCFEQCDWVGVCQDVVECIVLYDLCIVEQMDVLCCFVGEVIGECVLWLQVYVQYSVLLWGLIDVELYKIFYNMLLWCLFFICGVDLVLEFIVFDVELFDVIIYLVVWYIYVVLLMWLVEVLQCVLVDYCFDILYVYQLCCVVVIVVCLQDDLVYWGDMLVCSIELFDIVFYCECCVYLVGCVFGEYCFLLCVIVLVNDECGLCVDVVLICCCDVVYLFGVLCSYFQVDFVMVGDVVVFLCSLLLGKFIDEIYMVLGCVKQGKIECYCIFFCYFNEYLQEWLVFVEGMLGMVMVVFILFSYLLVFKLICDCFVWFKVMLWQQVEEKYVLVFNFDCVGCLFDVQLYCYLCFL